MKTLLSLLALAASLTVAELPASILLWPDGAPGSEGNNTPEVVVTSENGEQRVSNIHKPAITPYLPAKDKATGAAVIIAPGGGHKMLCTTHEGRNVAEWLAERGIAAFVLKYRLGQEPGSTYTVDDHAVADMHRAIRIVRSRAKEWNINPAAVGVMGFSAGGEVCAISSMRFTAGTAEAPDPLNRLSDRPDFQALIYPGSSVRIIPLKESPPVFLAASSNDRPDISEGLTKVYLDFKNEKIPVELHLYADGGHGFGYRKGRNGPVDGWIDHFPGRDGGRIERAIRKSRDRLGGGDQGEAWQAHSPRRLPDVVFRSLGSEPQVEELTIISCDEDFPAYGLPLLW